LRDALERALSSGDVPWLIISDSVAVTAPANNPTVAQLLHIDSPLSILYLFSNSVFRAKRATSLLKKWQRERIEAAHLIKHRDPAHELLDLWKHLGIISTVRPKSEENEMLSDLRTLAERWDRPTVARFRRYLQKECKHPDEPYFAHRAGTVHLSAIDLHREMVLGTALGLEQEAIWSEIFEGDSASGAPSRPRRRAVKKMSR